MLTHLKKTPDCLTGKVVECSCPSCNTSMIADYSMIWMTEDERAKQFYVFCDYECALLSMNAETMPKA